MKTKEIFIDINGFEELYKISNKGRVMSVGYEKCATCKRQGKIGRFLACPVLRNGYRMCTLSKTTDSGQFRKTKSVHRLVAEHFIGNPPGGNYVVNHIDGNKLNNKSTNLEWITIAENTQHAYAMGLAKGISKQSHTSL